MKRKVFSIFLVSTIFLVSCQSRSVEPNTTDDERFSSFANELFKEEISSDSLSLHYTLKHPEKAGIKNLPKGFSVFSYDSLKKAGISYENTLATLKEFDKGSLSPENRRLYDVLQETLILNIQGQSFLAFTEVLGPTTGIQAQLPILLAEFRFESKEDLDQYFLLLQTLPDYFQSLLSLEEEKSREGTLLCRSTLEHIIAQCETFQKEKGDRLLINSFNKKMHTCSFLSETEKKTSQKKAVSYVNEYVTGAYSSLISGLKKLLPLTKEEGSLSSYENGKSYYEYLVKQTTGSSRSVDALEQHMTRQLNTSEETLLAYAKKDPSLFSSCDRYATFYHSSEEILATLEKKIVEDFPLLSETSFEIKNVDESLTDYLSPAFYLTPPLDDSKTNIIYINQGSRYDPSSLFNTLAHEGYPGHLYQTCYMYEKGLPPLRSLLSYAGYTEGFATYAEIYSYKYTGVSKEEVGILRNRMIATLCLYGLCDIGVHYRGWGVSELANFLQEHGGYSVEAAKSVYSSIVDEPASYLKYAVGYLEFSRLKDEAKKQWKNNFSEKNFHTFVLDMGPMSFSLLEKYLPEWKARV